MCRTNEAEIVSSTRCMPGLHVVFCRLLIFSFKISDVKKYFGIIISVSKGLDPDQGTRSGV